MADNEQIVKEIAERLGETNEIPLWQITKIVERNGADFAYFMVELAEEIHREGLMMVLDGSRPRTLGGVFFNAVRDGLAYKFRYEMTLTNKAYLAIQKPTSSQKCYPK